VKIWKYEFKGGSMMWEMPRSAEILAVQYQREVLCLWARVDPNKPTESRWFQVYGTGHEIESGPALRYVGTVQQNSLLVWHVFEVMRNPQ
jgi:hypothetical protein